MPSRSTSLQRPLTLAVLALSLALAGAFALRGCAEESVQDAPLVSQRRDDVLRDAHVSGGNPAEPQPLLDASARVEEPTSAPVIELPPASLATTVRGVVVDEHGSPVEDALVRIDFSDSSPSQYMDTLADGLFQFRLATPRAFGIDAQTRMHHPSPAVDQPYEPGTTDVRIVLRTIPLTTFVVRDRATGAAVKSFRMILRYDQSSPYTSNWSWPRPLLETADGTNTVRAAEGQHIVQCEAPGYATYEAIVRHDPPGSGRQSILLDPDSRIEGRLKREQLASIQLAQQPHVIPSVEQGDPEHGIGMEWFGRHRFE